MTMSLPSRKVSSGGSGVRSTPSLRSDRPRPVKSSTVRVFRL